MNSKKGQSGLLTKAYIGAGFRSFMVLVSVRLSKLSLLSLDWSNDESVAIGNRSDGDVVFESPDAGNSIPALFGKR